MKVLLLPPYIQGALYSFIFLLAIGPSFFYLLSLSIVRGFRSGAIFAMGMLLSDITIMAVIYFGFGELFETAKFKLIFNGVGGFVLTAIGIKFILEKEIKRINDSSVEIKTGKLANFSKGFLVNITNPFAFIAWITVRTTVAQTHPEFSRTDYLLFFSGLFGMLALFELSKAFLAHKIGKFLTNRVLTVIHKLLGILFGCIGLWLVYLMYQDLLKL